MGARPVRVFRDARNRQQRACVRVGLYAVWYVLDRHDLFKLFSALSPKRLMRFLHFVEADYLDSLCTLWRRTTWCPTCSFS